MKAISLHQPWASAVACGSKLIETRSWKTSYRGPLAIHAAKRCNKMELLSFHCCCWNWTGALWKIDFGTKPGLSKEASDAPAESKLPFGAVIAVCNLADCRPTESFTVGELDEKRSPDDEVFGSPHLLPRRRTLYDWTERQLGDFSPGRFGWVLANVLPIKPFPFVGKRMLFDVPDSLIPKK